jgi:hypothetical protein
MNNANPSLRMPNITHNGDHTLCDQMDDFLQPTRNDETFLNTGDNSDHFLFHPRPPNIRVGSHRACAFRMCVANVLVKEGYRPCLLKFGDIPDCREIPLY